jgi:hypothetical protein
VAAGRNRCKPADRAESPNFGFGSISACRVSAANKALADPNLIKRVAGSPNTPDHEDGYAAVKQRDESYPDT